jgi:hypothetical protein
MPWLYPSHCSFLTLHSTPVVRVRLGLVWWVWVDFGSEKVTLSFFLGAWVLQDPVGWLLRGPRRGNFRQVGYFRL